MGKTHTTLTIDEELLKEAKIRRINMSEELDKALKNVVGKKEKEILEPAKCEFCGREMRKATADNLKGLTWLSPDEKWICPSCLRNQKTAI